MMASKGMHKVNVNRGDVWLVNLNSPGKGREIHRTRPALIVSADAFNNCPAELVMVLPVTSTDTRIPSHIRLDPPDGGVKKKSFIKCDQIRTISKQRLIKKWGSVPKSIMRNVEQALRYLMCL